MPKMKEQTIEQEAKSTLRRLEEKDKGLKQLLSKAYGYAVFPTVGKASLVVGGSYRKGAVFEQGKFIGYATIGQTTIGVQIGGDTFTEVVVFENKQTLERLKKGQMAFAADASAVLVKAGAAAARGFGGGTRAFVYGDGGMLLEAAIGGQKFNFKPVGAGKGGKSGQASEKSNREKDQDGGEDQAEAKDEESQGDDESEEQESEGVGGVLQRAKDVVSGAVDFAKEHPWATGIAGAAAVGGVAWMIAKRFSSGQQADSDQDQEGEQDQEDEPDEQMSGEQEDQEEGEQEDQDQDEEQEGDENMSAGRGRNSNGGLRRRSGAFARG